MTQHHQLCPVSLDVTITRHVCKKVLIVVMCGISQHRISSTTLLLDYCTLDVHTYDHEKAKEEMRKIPFLHFSFLKYDWFDRACIRHVDKTSSTKYFKVLRTSEFLLKMAFPSTSYF
jgi:hypothetical protein